ncbi:WASH complex subunit 2 isoform X2 [Cylas formicarius]|uniref:WASH complex subunit 2 isoform X2 n=1 Tax=Cylas formicarius TaxID=197179 RepID=UPI0029587F43|nr:WASH complex subunit 2 isoform X2 [Cylas formicarius]
MANGADGCWSTEQIIADAGNWSLAGDVALLNNLKAFSEKVLNETVQISRNVDKLLDNVNDVGIRLDLAKNEFQSLRNSQFVESRVYEDDETIDGASKSDNKGEPADLTEDQKEMVIKQAIQTGLKVMANYYDKVAITAATDVDRGYILQSKDSYAHRPLPYLVGSQEWYMKWHVGLLKTDIKKSQKEDELPKDKALESHSGLDISSNHDEVQANAVSNETVDVNVNHTLNAPITNLTFAEQLTQKLSTVITSDINKNPIKQNAENKYPRSLFSDEPPPLDVTVLPKKVSDSDDNEQSGEKISASQSLSADEVDKDSDYYLRHFKRQTKGLFDETDESSDDEGDIFAKVGRPKGDKPFLQPFKSTTPFLDEEPPELKPKKKNDVLKKKPAGGVSILEEDFVVPFQKANRSPSISSQEKKKNSSLFDGSSEDEFVTAIKPGSETSSFKNNDDPKIPIKKKEGTDTKITNNANFDSLEPTQEEPSREPKKKISLFDDDFLEDEDDIFGNIGAEKNLFKDLKSDMGQKHMLFEDSDELDDSSSFLSSSFQNKTLFEDLEGSEKHTEEKEQIMPGKIQRKDTISKLRKNCGLFDSSEDENSDEDIFIKKKIEKEVEKSRDMTNKIENNVNLFEGTEDEDIFHKKIDKEDSKIIKIEKDSVLNNKKPPIDESGKTANLFSSIEDEDSNKNVMPEDTKIDSKAKQATGLFSSDEDEGADDFTKKDEHDKDQFKPSVNLFNASGDGDDEGVFTQQVNSSAEGQLEAEQSNIRQVVLHKTDTNNRMKGPWQSAVEEKDNIGKQYQEKEESRQNSAEKAIRECGEITAPKVMEQEAANFKTDGKLNLFTALHNDVEVTTDTKDAVGEDLDVDENGGIGGIPEIKVTSTTSDKPSKSTSKDSTKKSRVINLFDPTPPPDDNFWDNSDDSDLEGFSINDDFNREPTPRRGSSLFNNDPPSINPNDSSGIVRDQDSIRFGRGIFQPVRVVHQEAIVGHLRRTAERGRRFPYQGGDGERAPAAQLTEHTGGYEKRKFSEQLRPFNAERTLGGPRGRSITFGF